MSREKVLGCSSNVSRIDFGIYALTEDPSSYCLLSSAFLQDAKDARSSAVQVKVQAHHLPIMRWTGQETAWSVQWWLIVGNILFRVLFWGSGTRRGNDVHDWWIWMQGSTIVYQEGTAWFVLYTKHDHWSPVLGQVTQTYIRARNILAERQPSMSTASNFTRLGSSDGIDKTISSVCPSQEREQPSWLTEEKQGCQH